MGITLRCDRCGYEENIRTLGLYHTFQPVSPGNNCENDRLLCKDCDEIYQLFKKVNTVDGLLGWIDNQIVIPLENK